MLKTNDTDTIKDHWGTVDKLVEKWLHERQEVILLLCAVDGLKEYTPKNTPISVKIQALCQVLIDYVSAGHFEIYDELMSEAEEFGDNTDLAKSLYPKIQITTDAAVDFNDRYDSAEHCEKLMSSLPTDLSHLGEKLEERFELEDQLIEVLHLRHKELVSSPTTTA
ncbi:MAG: sigma D regulator [Pseudomonadales bacterium]|nr:sigma D regulator [Pseudomonadales bacterium]